MTTAFGISAGIQPPEIINQILTCFAGSLPGFSIQEQQGFVMPGIDTPGITNMLMMQVKTFMQPLFDFYKLFKIEIMDALLNVSTFLGTPASIARKVQKIVKKMATFVFAYPKYVLDQVLERLTIEFKTISLGIKDMITSTIREGKNRLRIDMTELRANIQRYLDKLEAAGDEIVQTIYGIINELLIDASRIIENIKDLLADPMKLVNRLINKLKIKIYLIIGEQERDLGEVRAWIETAIDSIKSTIRLLVFIFALPMIIIKQIITLVKQIISNAINELRQLLSKQVQYFTIMINEKISEAINTLLSKLGLGEQMINIIQCFIGAARGIIAGFPGNIGQITNLVTLDVNTGLSLPQLSVPSFPGLNVESPADMLERTTALAKQNAQSALDSFTANITGGISSISGMMYLSAHPDVQAQLTSLQNALSAASTAAKDASDAAVAADDAAANRAKMLLGSIT